MTKCALCHKEKILCRSHIIPEFMYQAIYDEKHRFHIMNTAEGKNNRIAQKGIRERLLCSSCETRFSEYEGYVNKVLNGGIKLGFSKSEDGLTFVKGIDYKKFRLFQLSVLWRAAWFGFAPLPLIILTAALILIAQQLVRNRLRDLGAFGPAIVVSTFAFWLFDRIFGF